jgi:hypothetical protein
VSIPGNDVQTVPKAKLAVAPGGQIEQQAALRAASQEVRVGALHDCPAAIVHDQERPLGEQRHRQQEPQQLRAVVVGAVVEKDADFRPLAALFEQELLEVPAVEPDLARQAEGRQVGGQQLPVLPPEIVFRKIIDGPGRASGMSEQGADETGPLVAADFAVDLVAFETTDREVEQLQDVGASEAAYPLHYLSEARVFRLDRWPGPVLVAVGKTCREVLVVQ